jgi:hypothetical protein
VDHPLSKRDTPASDEEAALSFVAKKLGLSEDDLQYKTGFAGEAASHVYIKQKIVRPFVVKDTVNLRNIAKKQSACS